MNGLRNIVSTSELGGLSSHHLSGLEVDGQQRNHVADDPGSPQAQQKVRQVQGKSPNFLLTGLKQQQRFYELLEQQVHFNSDKGLTAGGRIGDVERDGNLR
jgi:hypothetical protein